LPVSFVPFIICNSDVLSDSDLDTWQAASKPIVSPASGMFNISCLNMAVLQPLSGTVTLKLSVDADTE
jgi:hypothetical protein